MPLKNTVVQLVDRLKTDAKATAILADWLGDGAIPVDSALAEKRAKTCSGCSFNKPSTRRVENKVAETIRSHEEVRNRIELRTSNDGVLKNCEVCSCYLRLKVWVPLKHLIDDTKPFPGHCWIKTEAAQVTEVDVVTPEESGSRGVIKIRRENAFGDVIQATILATKMWELGYDVWWRCSDATRSALLHHPHIAGFITNKDAPVDVNLDRSYEDNIDRSKKSMATIFIETAEHQLKKGGFEVPTKANQIPFLHLTEEELAPMRKQLDGTEGHRVAFIPRSNNWPNRTIHQGTFDNIAKSIRGAVIWAGAGKSESEFMHQVEIRSFRDLMALIYLADVVVTPDTGPLHVAAAFCKPMVVIEQAIPIHLRLTDQTDWKAVSAPIGCIGCGEFTCPIDAKAPPCQKVEWIDVAMAANGKLSALGNHGVSVIIPTMGQSQRLRKCVDHAFPQETVTEVVVSVDGTGTTSEECVVISKAPGRRTGFGATCMRGARASHGEFLLFLNDDCYLNHGAVDAMLKTMLSDDNIAVVGAQLWYPDGTIQHGGTTRRRGDIGFGHIDWKQRTPTLKGEHDMEFVTFAAALVRRSVFYKLRGFDEEYDCYCEDSDFCLKAKSAGYRVVYNANATAIHDESQSTSAMKDKLHAHGERIFRRKWTHYFEQNPVK